MNNKNVKEQIQSLISFFVNKIQLPIFYSYNKQQKGNYQSFVIESCKQKRVKVEDKRVLRINLRKIQMGNQIDNGYNFVDCKIDQFNDPLNKQNQTELKTYQNYKDKNMRSLKGIKRLSGKRQNLTQKRLNQLDKNQYLKDKTQFGVRTLQKQTQNTQKQINPNIIHFQMEKAYRYMKSLTVLQNFQQKYNKEYPILILNKDVSTKKLRQQINKQKQNHQYFQIDNFTQQHILLKEKTSINHKNSPDSKRNINYQQEIFYHFMVLQRIQWLLIRLYQTGRHSNVLKHLKLLDNQFAQNIHSNCEEKVKIQLQKVQDSLQKMDRFVKSVDSLDIELMDMLFYQMNQNKLKEQIDNITHWQNGNKNQPKFINLKQLIIKSKQLQNMNKKLQFQINQYQQNGSSSYQSEEDINSYENDNGVNDYENCKKLGWQIYKQNKVCFYILAVGNQTFCPQLQPLNIPFNLTIIQILFEKYDAFAQLLQLKQLTLNILIDTKRILKLNQLMQKNINKWQRLNIRVLKTQQLPLLDIEGNFILNQNTVRMASIGTADLWNCIQEDLNQLQNFQYIQVLEAKNCLEWGFDCFFLGKIKSQNLQWGIKVLQPIQRFSQLPIQRFSQLPIQRLSQLSFIKETNKFQKIHQSHIQSSFREPILTLIPSPRLIYPTQTYYSQYLNLTKSKSQPYYVSSNHILMSMPFVKKVLVNREKSPKAQFRKKLIIQEDEQLLVFQRDFIDQAIEQSMRNIQQDFQRWGIFLYEREDCYYPLKLKQNDGIFDIQGCSRRLNMNYLSQLDLSVNKFLQNSLQKSIKCYIDPHVSLQGSELEDIRLQIERKINQILTENKYLAEIQFKMSPQNLQNNSLNNQTITIKQNKQSKNNNKNLKKFTNQKLQYDLLDNLLIPSQVVSSISQIVILSLSNQKSQKQISIFIN